MPLLEGCGGVASTVITVCNICKSYVVSQMGCPKTRCLVVFNLKLLHAPLDGECVYVAIISYLLFKMLVNLVFVSVSTDASLYGISMMILYRYAV